MVFMLSLLQRDNVISATDVTTRNLHYTRNWIKKNRNRKQEKKVGTGVLNHGTAIPLEVLVLTSKL